RNVLARRRDAGGDRRCPAMNGMEAVGVHVVREAGRAADAGNDHGAFALDPKLRHEALERSQHSIVAAAGAPADLLIACEVFAVQGLERQWYAGKTSVALSRGGQAGRGTRRVWSQRVVKLRVQL